MKLKVLGSSSKGNGYILENSKEALIIECGVSVSKAKKALNFNTKKVAGAIVTHEHGDHANFIEQYVKAGISVYASRGTLEAKYSKLNHRTIVLESTQLAHIGGFSILPFDILHDAAEPFGYLIHHPDIGLTLFVNDTHYLENKFAGLQNIIIEANYSEQLMQRSSLFDALKDRTRQAHMEIETTIGFLNSTDLSGVTNIVLIHLSDGNSDEAEFEKRVVEQTGKMVYVADAGKEIELNLF